MQLQLVTPKSGVDRCGRGGQRAAGFAHAVGALGAQDGSSESKLTTI